MRNDLYSLKTVSMLPKGILYQVTMDKMFEMMIGNKLSILFSNRRGPQNIGIIAIGSTAKKG